MKAMILFSSLMVAAPVYASGNHNGDTTNNYYTTKKNNDNKFWKGVAVGILVGVGITCTVKGCDWFVGSKPQKPEPKQEPIGYEVKQMPGTLQ